MALTVSLNQDERIIVNGAVITLGKKNGQIVFLNQARILHQHHVLTEEQIRAAMLEDGDNRNDSWFYYLIQLMYIDPENAEGYIAQFKDTVSSLREDFPGKDEEIDAIIALTADAKLYQALKTCRDVFPDCLPPTVY